MKKQQEASVAGYDLKRVDKAALIIIWILIGIISIEQFFLKNAGNKAVFLLLALGVGALVTAVYFLKLKRFLKSFLMCFIPALAVLLVLYSGDFALDKHYMLAMACVLAALYFDPKLLLVYGISANTLLIAVFLLRPEGLLGQDHTWKYFLSIFFLYGGETVTLYFLTRWGREILRSAEKGKAELEEVLGGVQQARLLEKKQADYMNAEVQKLLVSMDALAMGELDLNFCVAEPDDDTKDAHAILSGIAQKLFDSVESIRGYMYETGVALEEVSKGNLRAEIETEFKGDFAQMKSTINSIILSLNTTMDEINLASEQVAAGTRQVSSGSQAISQGATEQASAIEELTASVAEIAAQTRENALKANDANALSVSAKENALQGDAQMEELQRAMQEINEASTNISRIIGVIDEIAFQTNILALNAAVEAARAGAHGKGFAVVAEEVRSLAGKSADAANETTALIESSVQKAKRGTAIADQTAKALKRIQSATEKAALLVGGIAEASSEQATAIAQVNGFIEQMASVVQTNSATAQQAAAAGEQLSGQAELLKEKVDRFTLRERRPASPKAASGAAARPLTPVLAAKGEGEFGKY